MKYYANFGPEYVLSPVGVTEHSSAGAIIVPRTVTGVTHVANGLFMRDFTPHAGTDILVWDTAGAEPVYAPEVLQDIPPTATEIATEILGTEI